jgi:hypothetical protein
MPFLFAVPARIFSREIGINSFLAVQGVYTTLVTSSVWLILSKFVTSSKFSRFEDCSSLETPRCEWSSLQILRCKSPSVQHFCHTKHVAVLRRCCHRLLCSLTTTFFNHVPLSNYYTTASTLMHSNNIWVGNQARRGSLTHLDMNHSTNAVRPRSS